MRSFLTMQHTGSFTSTYFCVLGYLIKIILFYFCVNYFHHSKDDLYRSRCFSRNLASLPVSSTSSSFSIGKLSKNKYAILFIFKYKW